MVATGAVHSEKNVSGRIVRGIVELAPAAMTAELHDALAETATDLPHGPTGAPRIPSSSVPRSGTSATTSGRSRHPCGCRTLSFPPLPLAKLVGVEPMRPAWAARPALAYGIRRPCFVHLRCGVGACPRRARRCLPVSRSGARRSDRRSPRSATSCGTPGWRGHAADR